MNALSDFWRVVGDVSDAGVLGVSLGNVLSALGILILFLMIRRIFFRVVVTSITMVTKKTKTTSQLCLLVVVVQARLSQIDII